MSGHWPDRRGVVEFSPEGPAVTSLIPNARKHMYFTDRGIEELTARRGEEQVSSI